MAATAAVPWYNADGNMVVAAPSHCVEETGVGNGTCYFVVSTSITTYNIDTLFQNGAKILI